MCPVQYRVESDTQISSGGTINRTFFTIVGQTEIGQPNIQIDIIPEERNWLHKITSPALIVIDGDVVQLEKDGDTYLNKNKYYSIRAKLIP